MKLKLKQKQRKALLFHTHKNSNVKLLTFRMKSNNIEPKRKEKKQNCQCFVRSIETMANHQPIANTNKLCSCNTNLDTNRIVNFEQMDAMNHAK